MATNENLIPIPGRLHSVASDEIVSGADLIYDDKLSDNLENLNTGFTNDIDAIYNTIGDNNEKGAIMEQLNTIDGRLDTIDGEISALNSIPIEVVPLNSNGTAPNVNNPLENTLYRAYNSDNTLYSDWMYQDGSWVMITQLLEPTSLEKLVGYYTCNTAANTPGKEVITGNSGYILPANGGAMKIKMTNVNTVDNATLKIGSETAKPLWYNDGRASSSNTWEEGEVISVYYDGENYRASNALGGGSAVGKKKLVPIPGYIENNGATLGSIYTTSSDRTNYRYIKLAAKEGDVVQISGTGASGARLWGIVGEEDIMLDAAAVNITAKGLVVVMPEGTAFITINSTTASNPEWYYAKAGSVGAHEILTEAYLYGNIRQLALGEKYSLDEPVKSVGKQLLKVTKEVTAMSIADEVAIGDLKVNGNNTYQAQKAMSIYNGNTVYSENDFAIGSPAGAVIQVSADAEIIANLVEAVDITVTIADIECTINIASEDDAASIAGKIVTAFGTQTEWNLTVDSIDDTKLNLISKVAKDTAPTISSSVGESGVTVGFVTGSDYAGSTELSQFDGSSWSTSDLATYAADAVAVGEVDSTKMWKTLSSTEFIKTVCEQGYVTKLYNRIGLNIDGGITQKEFTDSLYKYTAISPITTITGELTINPSTGKFYDISYKYSSFIIYSVDTNNTYRIAANSTNAAHYAWLRSYPTTTVRNTSPDYVSGESNVEIIGVNKEVLVTPPSDAKYLYVTNYYRSSASATKVTRNPSFVGTIQLKTDEITEKTDSTAESLNELSKNVEYIVTEDITSYVGPLRTGGTGTVSNYVTSVNDPENTQNGVVTVVSPAGSKRFGWFIGSLPINTEILIEMSITASGNVGGYTAFDKNDPDGNINSTSSGGSIVYRWYDSAPSNNRVYPKTTTRTVRFIIKRDYTMTFMQCTVSELKASEILTISNFKATLICSKTEYDKYFALSELKQTLKYAIAGNNTAKLSLLHFSDMHGDGNAAFVIRNFYEKNASNIDDILNTGDVVRNYYGQGIGFYTYANLTNALFCIGNHDSRSSSNDTTWTGTARDEVYARYIAPYVEGWGVTQPENADTEYKMYWYKDYTTEEVRLICLDGPWSYSDSEYRAAQVSWFTNLLQETITEGSSVEGFKVLVCCHYMPGTYTSEKVVRNTNGDATHWHTFDGSTSDARIVSSIETYSVVNSAYTNAIDTFISNGGKFVAWICGHYHWNMLTYLTNHPNILVVCVSNTGVFSASGVNTAKTENDILGQVCANQIVLNGNYLTIIRLGITQDAYLRSTKSITYDWVNKKVISES